MEQGGLQHLGLPRHPVQLLQGLQRSRAVQQLWGWGCRQRLLPVQAKLWRACAGTLSPLPSARCSLPPALSHCNLSPCCAGCPAAAAPTQRSLAAQVDATVGTDRVSSLCDARACCQGNTDPRPAGPVAGRSQPSLSPSHAALTSQVQPVHRLTCSPPGPASGPCSQKGSQGRGSKGGKRHALREQAGRQVGAQDQRGWRGGRKGTSWAGCHGAGHSWQLAKPRYRPPAAHAAKTMQPRLAHLRRE